MKSVSLNCHVYLDEKFVAYVYAYNVHATHVNKKKKKMNVAIVTSAYTDYVMFRS